MLRIRRYNFLLIMLLFFALAVSLNQDPYKVYGESSHVTPDQSLQMKSDYEKYLMDNQQNYPNRVIALDIFTYQQSNMIDEFAKTLVKESVTGLYLPEEGKVEWTFNVPEAGFYNVLIEYYPIEGKSSPIERTIFVNGEVPFSDLNSVTFFRFWKDTFNVTDTRLDKENDIKPSQIEAPRWESEYIRDSRGKHITPFFIAFNEGVNTLAFEAIREPMLISSITLLQADPIKSYSETKAYYNQEGYEAINQNAITLQGEDASLKSSPTLYPINDRSSMRTVPYHRSLIRLNAIGGFNWRVPGDFIVWEVEVEEAGLYHISLKALQNFSRGSITTRALYINGEIPFFEASQLEFAYNRDWQNITLGNDEEAYYFYLEAGVNEIKLASAVGKYGDLIDEVQAVINELNLLYREIIMFTSVSPDPYRDYLLERRIPDLKLRLEEAKVRLENVMEEVINVSGTRSDRIASLETTINQLDDFIRSPRQIQNRLNEYRENISALGTWVLTATQQPLTIDYMVFHDDAYTLPRAKANFFEKIWHEVMIFMASFFTDYSVLRESNVEGDERIEVWLSAGRDQANVLRQLIDETFTPNSNITVELKVVNADVLLPATLAGNGPDVAMTVAQDLPVNFAMRNALYDLTQFPDYEEVSERFFPSALTPYEYRGGVYGLPEQFIFLVLFYRTDILEELGLTPPTTWDEVIEIVPILQRYSLDFFLPQTPTALNPLYYAMVKQRGGNLYTDDGKEIALLDEAGTEAFVQFANFYADYSFTVQANFVNRFRSGEMPIGISYYTDYNVLSVFAPEISGQWDFMELPGTRLEDGSIDNTSTGISNAVVMLEHSDKKDASWEYMKWWTSTDTQVRFAREMEGILGAAARYPTANKEALSQLPWPTKNYRVLSAQAEKTAGIPVVPGSYITGRYIDNAYRDVINNGVNPREALFDYTRRINAELARKRQEFGLD
ncbi:extracellular solute-binding protein [Liberiplasma polymorphum]|uniref:extracellular solute-binding protein n=1 Tax=Liberiplasma polymorphum TaxID=3374570 RepID=UPI0037728A26